VGTRYKANSEQLKAKSLTTGGIGWEDGGFSLMMGKGK
jgi:hypothetical protein